MKIIIPKQIPFSVLKEISINFCKQQICSETTRRKSAFHLQKTILDFITEEGHEVIDSFRDIKLDTDNLNIEKEIWILWWQGLPVSNKIAEACINRVRNVKDFNFNFITKENVSKYIDISDILPLFNKGYLYIQHLADIIRIRLLKEYGGFWLDSSIALMDLEYLSNIARHFPFFSNKFYDYDKVLNISEGMYSTYFWGTFRNNPFFDFVDKMMTSFVIKHKGVIDYTQFDYSIMAGYRNIDFIKKMIDSIPFNNQNSWWLNDKLFNEFDSSLWNEITKETYFFKLSAKKYNEYDSTIQGVGKKTYWDYIVNSLWK